MPSSVIHIIPSGVFNNNYHGSYKDIISRVRFFEKCGLPYRQLRLKQDEPHSVLDMVKDDSDPAFLMEYCSFPKSLKAIKRSYPKSFIGIRAHNIEPLQHLHNGGWWPANGPLRVAYAMMRLFRDDLVMKRYATAIYSISDWENSIYWKWLPGHARIKWLPYFCPDHLLPARIVGVEEKRRIVCLPTSQKNRKSWHLVTRFIKFAERMEALSPENYEFLVTGDLTSWDLPPSNVVKFTGMIDDLRSFLPTVKAIGMLSDRGFGFKTTIADAIANGAIVLAHPRLASRCPTMLQSSILAVNIDNEADIKSAINYLNTMQVHTALNQKLRDVSQQLLREICSPIEEIDAA